MILPLKATIFILNFNFEQATSILFDFILRVLTFVNLKASADETSKFHCFLRSEEQCIELMYPECELPFEDLCSILNIF